MDVSTLTWWIFWSAFMGSAVGLPVGFFLIEVIKAIRYRAEMREDPLVDVMEWAVTSKGAKVIEAKSVANNTVRIFDIEDIYETTDEDGHPVFVEDPGCKRFIVQSMGQNIGAPKPRDFDTEEEARVELLQQFQQVRKKLGLR